MVILMMQELLNVSLEMARKQAVDLEVSLIDLEASAVFSARHGINYECLFGGPTLDARTATTKKPSSAQIAFKRGDYKPYEPTTETSSGVLKSLRNKTGKLYQRVY